MLYEVITEGFGGAPVPAVQFKERVKQMFGESADEFLAKFPVNTDEEAFAVQNDLGALQTFGIQSYKWMQLQNKTATADVFVYRFERDVPFADGMQDFGAFHTGEVPYAYNNLKMSPRPWTEADYKLANTMSDYWVNFAKTGNPNGVITSYSIHYTKLYEDIRGGDGHSQIRGRLKYAHQVFRHGFRFFTGRGDL